MHRIDADAHVSNMFDPGDPLEPRPPTQVDADWLNAVQEEIANTIEACTRPAIPPVLQKGVNTQLRDALPLRAHGRVKLNATPGGAPSIESGERNLASAALVAGVPNRIRVTFSNAMEDVDYTVSIMEVNIAGLVQPLMPAGQSQAAGSFDFVLFNTTTGAIVDPATLSSREYAITVHHY